MVDWLVNNGLEKSREAAVEFGNKLLENYIFHHVTRDHKFKDENLYYRFDKDWKQKISSPESWGQYVGNAGETGKAAIQPSLKPNSGDMEEALKDLEVTPHDEYNIKVRPRPHVTSNGNAVDSLIRGSNFDSYWIMCIHQAGKTRNPSRSTTWW